MHDRKVELGNTFQPKWIVFVERENPGRKTELWAVQSKYGEALGVIKLHGAWRKYAFFPYEGTLYEQDCLWDIADFCARKTKEWKESIRAKSPLQPKRKV